MILDTFIPRYVPASVILGSYILLSGLFRISDKTSKENYEANRMIWQKEKERFLDERGEYIEHQNQMEHLIYGKQNDTFSRWFLDGRKLSGKENTCEVSAVYNAVLGLNGKADFIEMLSYFEKHGAAFLGYLGTSPLSLKKYLKKQGYRVSVLKGKKIVEETLFSFSYDEDRKQGENQNLKSENATYIFTTYNNKNHLLNMLHTMCITRQKEGFKIHNDYEGSKCYTSLADAVFGYNGGRGKPIFIMRIENDSTIS